MKSYDIALDLKRIRTFFDLSQQNIAEQIGLSKSNILRIENKQINPHPSSIELIYSFSYENGLNLNKEKARFFKEENRNDFLLFHGARDDIKGEIDVNHSLGLNDFGSGFYLGETLQQASTWVAANRNASVYCFYLKNNKALQCKEFFTNREWLYAVLYYRHAFSEDNVPNDVKKIVDEIESLDYLIAPIADNKMYEIINNFIEKKITDEACLHALAMTDLGKQFVLKSQKAINNLVFLDRLYLCRKEKDDYLKIKTKVDNESYNKVKMSLLEYRRKGKYIDELFK